MSIIVGIVMFILGGGFVAGIIAVLIPVAPELIAILIYGCGGSVVFGKLGNIIQGR